MEEKNLPNNYEDYKELRELEEELMIDEMDAGGLIEDLESIDDYEDYKVENHNLNPEEWNDILNLYAQKPESLSNDDVKRLVKLSQKNIPDYANI